MMAVRSEIARKMLPLPAHWEHDMWLYISASNLCRVVSIPDVLIRYRFHADNLSGHQRNNNITSRRTYYRDSLIQYRWDELRWKEILEYWQAFPENSYKRAYFAAAAPYRRHMNVRVDVQDHLICKLPKFLWEVLTFGYFRFPQPLRCMLFDLKEGVLIRLRGNNQDIP